MTQLVKHHCKVRGALTSHIIHPPNAYHQVLYVKENKPILVSPQEYYLDLMELDDLTVRMCSGGRRHRKRNVENEKENKVDRLTFRALVSAAELRIWGRGVERLSQRVTVRVRVRLKIERVRVRLKRSGQREWEWEWEWAWKKIINRTIQGNAVLQKNCC